LNQPISFKKAIDILHRTKCSSGVIQHCINVSSLAVKVGNKLNSKGVRVDLELVRIGGLLHDVGRSKTHEVSHGVVGADILRSMNLPLSVIHIVERHVGSGIPADEAVKLGLPNRDFIPETIEEKIVTYSDKLIEGDRKISFDEALTKLSNEFGECHAIVKRFKQIHSVIGE